jgi:3-oxoadipate enol-lactonase
MANVDTAPKLKSLSMPVLCLAGRDDRSTPPPVVKAMADAIPDARYAVLPGGPHMMFFEMPDETAQIIAPFFHEVLSRPQPTSP